MGKKSRQKASKKSAPKKVEAEAATKSEEKAAPTPMMIFLDRHWPWLIAGVVLFLFLLGVDRFFFFQGGDNAEYIILGKNLAAGKGFMGSDGLPHGKFPPFFPLMLAGVIAVFGQSMIAIKVMIAFSAAAMVAATGFLYKSRNNDAIAIAATLLTAFIPFTHEYSHRVLSEIPYAAASMAALLFLDRAMAGDSRKKLMTALAAVFVLAAYFTRSIGVILIAAAAGAILLDGGLRQNLKGKTLRTAWVIGPAVLAAVLWALRSASLPGQDYTSQFFMKDPSNLDAGTIGLIDFFGRFIGGVFFYLGHAGRTVFMVSGYEPTALAVFMGVVLAAVSAIGLVRVMKTRKGAPELYFILYAALISIWPFNEDRFLLPLYPLIFYYFLNGISAVVNSLRAGEEGIKTAKAVMLGLTGLLMIFYVVEDFRIIGDIREYQGVKGHEVNPSFHVSAFNEGMADMLQLSIGLSQNAKSWEIVMARKPALVALVSGLRVHGGPFKSDPAELMKELDKKDVDYVVMDGVYEETARYLLPVIEANPHRFKDVYHLPDKNAAIYQVLPPGEQIKLTP